MELISREETWRKFTSEIDDIADLGDIDRILNSMPTVEERKEGEWIDAGWDGEKCSLCGWSIDDTFYSSQFLYCPNCGARIKGE